MLGSPGAGKGTQGKRLGQKYDIPAIGTGDMFRAAIENETEVGRKAKGFMDAGQLVPDDIVMEIVKERLKNGDTENGFILDGFPRTLGQANRFEKNVLQVMGLSLDAVLYIKVSKEVVVKRISGRRKCIESGVMYNLALAPEVWENSEDKKKGHRLRQRNDDKEDVVEKRFEVYMENTVPLIEHYKKMGLLREIDGEGTIDQVFERILEAL